MDELITYMETYPQIIVAIIAAAASIFGTLVSIISAIISCVFSSKAKAKDAKLKAELERTSAIYEQLIHAQNHRFDYEFDIYKELSKKTFMLSSALDNYLYKEMHHAHSDDEDKRNTSKHMLEDVHTVYTEFEENLITVAPFISENIYAEFESFRKKCEELYLHFYRAQYHDDYNRQSSDEYTAEERNNKIKKDRDNLIKELRIHLFCTPPIKLQ